MKNIDELAKYICDKVELTLKRYGRKVERTGDHALVVGCEPYPALTRTRILIRRTGQIEFEPFDPNYAKDFIPSLREHIADALAGEYEFTSQSDGGGVIMQPRATPKAPYALPAGT